MTWRLLLASVLSVAVFILYSTYIAPPVVQQRPQQGAPGALDGAREEVADHAPPRGAGSDAAERPDGAAPGDPESAADAARPERPRERLELVVGDHIRVEGDTRGGILSRISLPEFHETVEDRKVDKPYQLLFPPADGRGVLYLSIDDHPIPASENWELGRSDDGGALVFTNEVGGLRIRKIVRPPEDPTAYELRVRLEIENTTGAPATVRYSLGGPAGIDTESQRGEGVDVQMFAGTRARRSLVVTELEAAGLTNDEWVREEPAAWIGLANNYFASVLVVGDRAGDPERKQTSMAFAYAHADWEAMRRLAEKSGKTLDTLAPAELTALRDQVFKNARVGVQSAERTVAAGETLADDYVLFAGPRETDLLETYPELELVRINDYGWIGMLIKFFISFLDVLKTICFGSYGAAIIVLTVIVKLCLHPINRRSQKSMQRFQKKMQKIKPQMDELKERYPNDRMKMNQEMQKLWREHGINPGQQMGGCLVLFLQLPIWWALYNTLQYAIGLRQASFLYIEDLTRADHLFRLGLGFFGGYFEYFNVLPILYVILTLVNQKMQPKPTDPQMQAQMRMMSFMMVAFGFIFYGFPAGFMLYIMTSSGLSIIESKIIKAELAREEEAAGGANGAPSGGAAPPPSYPAKSQREQKAARPRRKRRR